jgi:predicted nucleic acid-binding protein
MQKIVVNDTNVFIDLLEIGLLDYFFQLSWEIHTTDLVMGELQREGQHKSVAEYQKTNKLHVASFEVAELKEILNLQRLYGQKTNVTITDCSVWFYAKREEYILLTGDKKLRASATIDGVEVRGILYVFDALVEEGVLSPSDAANKLAQLRTVNSRLPKDEIEKRLELWGDATSGKEDKYRY